MRSKNWLFLTLLLFITNLYRSPLVYAMNNDFDNFEESSKHISESKKQKLSELQLQKVSDDHLEAILGTGNNVLLKIKMSLESLKGLFNKEQREVPAQLFLTDFMSSPTNHSPVDLKVKVDCEPIAPICILPTKPQSFGNYDQFKNWLKQGYFTNQLNIIYDFHLDPYVLAPSLAKQLFFVEPGGYRITGTSVIHNAKIVPDDCISEVVYSSKRGSTNETVAIMKGTFYLNKKPYLIDSNQQIFPHPKTNEVVFKKSITKKFDSHKWLTQSETITQETYAEFQNDQIQNWPGAPSGTYDLLLKKQPNAVEAHDHIALLDGKSGENVAISDGRIFSVVHDSINGPAGSQSLDSIVKDNDGNLYTIRCKTTTISALSDDILKAVFLNLGIKDLKSTGRVSKRFNVLAGELFRFFPPLARGYEEVYQRFLKGVLIYRPQEGSDVGMIKLPITQLKNPLEGTFDLSKCGDISQYVSISTGYKKGKKPENTNKLEIWFAPRFLIEKEINATAQHFKHIFPDKWPDTAPIGIFWTWGDWDNMGWYDYLTNQDLNVLSNGENLHQKSKGAIAQCVNEMSGMWGSAVYSGQAEMQVSCFVFDLK